MRTVGCALPLALLLVAASAHAITITYVNAGPADSRVFVGFDNTSTGNATSDLVAHPNAFSRNDTLFGLLSPPAHDSVVFSGAELGTNLNAPLGSGVRSVFSPFNPTFFRSAGQTATAAGTYTGHAFAFSGQTTSTTPTPWIVHVDPSGAELPGTLADVTVSASIAGDLSVSGASLADAAWNVATTLHGTVISGAASQAVAGTSSFSDANAITFTLPLGSTFELLVDYDLSTSGSGTGASSSSEVTASLIEISAAIAPPPLFAPVNGAKLLMIDKYAAAGKAKVLLLMKDTTGAISKGLSADPPGLSGEVLIYQQSDPTNRAVFALDPSGWTKNKDTVANFRNAAAGPGLPGAKKAIIKPDKLVKVLAKTLGDGDAASGDQGPADLDLGALTPADVVVAVVTIDNANDSTTHRLCSQFEAPTLKPIAGGTGIKYLSKTSSLPTACPD